MSAATAEEIRIDLAGILSELELDDSEQRVAAWLLKWDQPTVQAIASIIRKASGNPTPDATSSCVGMSVETAATPGVAPVPAVSTLDILTAIRRYGQTRARSDFTLGRTDLAHDEVLARWEACRTAYDDVHAALAARLPPEITPALLCDVSAFGSLLYDYGTAVRERVDVGHAWSQLAEALRELLDLDARLEAVAS